jgi:hypothetical protein
MRLSAQLPAIPGAIQGAVKWRLSAARPDPAGPIFPRYYVPGHE